MEYTNINDIKGSMEIIAVGMHHNDMWIKANGKHYVVGTQEDRDGYQHPAEGKVPMRVMLGLGIITEEEYDDYCAEKKRKSEQLDIHNFLIDVKKYLGEEEAKRIEGVLGGVDRWWRNED